MAADHSVRHISAIPRGDGSDDIGSNNWVVGGRFTQSGFPYIVNDPHRSLATPSLRYFVHLHAPGWNVIGGGEPVLPGVSIGHNEHGGWGLTVFGQDNEDLYVYDVNPRDPHQYRYLGGWEEMRILRETIAIKGEPAEEVESSTRGTVRCCTKIASITKRMPCACLDGNRRLSLPGQPADGSGPDLGRVRRSVLV